jgi:hypothetical protein
MNIRTVFTALFLVVMLGGCVSHPVAPTPATIAAGVKPGDSIEVVIHDGSEARYRVVQVGSEALRVQPQQGGKPASVQSIPYGDIRELTVNRLNTTAIGNGLAVAAAATTVLVIWAMEHMGAVACC